MREVDRSPTRLSSAVAVGAGFVALLSPGLYSWTALAVGTLGLALLAAGVARGARSAVTVGALGLFAGAIVAGVRGAPVLPVLFGVTTAVLAWDVGGNAISVGRQLGRNGDTTRIEAVHAAASTAVGVAIVGVSYALYRTATGGQPVVALVLFLVAAVLLIQALD